jgi:hypothetical protein
MLIQTVLFESVYHLIGGYCISNEYSSKDDEDKFFGFKHSYWFWFQRLNLIWNFNFEIFFMHLKYANILNQLSIHKLLF